MDSLRLALEKLSNLRDTLSEEEFEEYRRRLVAHHTALGQQRRGSSTSSPANSEGAVDESGARPSPGESAASPSFGLPRSRRSSDGMPAVDTRAGHFVCPSPSSRLSPAGAFLQLPASVSRRQSLSSAASTCPSEESGVAGNEAQGCSGGNNCAVKLQPLPAETTTADLTQALSVFGTVTTAVINVGQPNYAYVRFADEASARAAHTAMNIYLFGKKVRVRLSKWKAGNLTSEPEPSTFIGLFNLPFCTTAPWLQQLLGNFPGFVDVRMMIRKGGAFAGYAFAEFRSVAEAAACRAYLSGLTLQGQTVEVKFATRPVSQ